jgi:hypothetical protein
VIDNISRFHRLSEVPEKAVRIMELTLTDEETGDICKFTLTLGRGGYGYPKVTLKTRSRKGKTRAMSLGCVPSPEENWTPKKKKNKKIKAK